MNKFKITSIDSIQSLFSKKNRNKFSRISIEVAGLDDAKAKHFEKRLNKYFFACGCATGEVFCLTSVGIYVLGHLFLQKSIIFGWTLVKHGILILFTSALVGKIVGLLYSKYKLRKTIGALTLELELASKLRL